MRHKIVDVLSDKRPPFRMKEVLNPVGAGSLERVDWSRHGRWGALKHATEATRKG
jgi:hypothetical protein